MPTRLLGRTIARAGVLSIAEAIGRLGVHEGLGRRATNRAV